MQVFNNYARYYDLLYQDKEYAAEADYIHSLLQRYASHTQTMLELGCGSGGHAVFLAQKGYRLHGIDFSQTMLQAAERRQKTLPIEQANRLSFADDDVRQFRTTEHFDAVISLFHVMSYQITNEDLQAAFATASYHLKAGGVFIFDCWYGPAVLTDLPLVRAKRFQDDEVQITRIAEPSFYPNENRVDVNYELFIQHHLTGVIEKIQETHQMRYLFMPEVKELLATCHLNYVGAEGWINGEEPGFSTWNICFISRK
jgi:cyclopropane fatty-acyl-phospholipid synthase-like methyltransferase